jgi:hypothetical protein
VTNNAAPRRISVRRSPIHGRGLFSQYTLCRHSIPDLLRDHRPGVSGEVHLVRPVSGVESHRDTSTIV